MKTPKQRMAENKARADDFIEAVAEFLVSHQGRKSIELEMGKPDALAWAKIMGTVNVGYSSKEEAVVAIRRILFAG